MADTTPRLNIPYPEGSDGPPDVASDMQAAVERVDAVSLLSSQGPIASRGAAGTARRVHWATDQPAGTQLSYDDGVAWRALPGPGLLPIGGVLDWPWPTEPPGPAEWIEMDGRTVTRAAYPELLNAVGVSGDSLVIPDRRGRSPMGAGLGPGMTENRVVGTSVGSESVTLMVSQLPSHIHSASSSWTPAHDHGGATNYDGAHNHGYAYGGWTATITASGWVEGGVYSVVRNPGTYQAITSDAPLHAHIVYPDGGHSHTITVNPTGSGSPVKVTHSSSVTRYFVRAR